MQELVCILNGRKKKNTGKVYYFHKGEHLVKFKYIKKKKNLDMKNFGQNLVRR